MSPESEQIPAWEAQIPLALGGTSATGGLSAGHSISIGMNSTGLGNTPAGQNHTYGKN